MIVIYAPKQPNFGRHLAGLIEDDGRFDLDILVLETEYIFEAMLHFPDVKMVVVSLSQEGLRPWWPMINWFFDQGGGVIGLGFAGSAGSTGPASANAFPLFANDYKSGKYDPAKKSFTQTFIKDTPHAISEGLGDFSTAAQRIVLSLNASTGEHIPAEPDIGRWTVLYRDSVYDAPVVVAYEGNGSSVTFATYGGEDFERSFSYYGLFGDSAEFVTLFTNAVHWVLENETRYGNASEAGREYLEELRSSKGQLAESVRAQRARERGQRTTQVALTLALAVAASAAVYWALIVKAR